MGAFANTGPRPMCQASVTCVKPWGCDWTTWVPEKWLKIFFGENTCYILVLYSSSSLPINHRLSVAHFFKKK